MTGSIMLKPAAGFTPWQFDSVNNEYFIEINGTEVARVGANAMKIPGRYLKG